MIFLHGSELVYADSYADIIEHYGVKGMKWGEGSSKSEQVNIQI